jgi:hypothetical protein
MEHLARNQFITLERQGTTWTLGAGDPGKAAADPDEGGLTTLP